MVWIWSRGEQWIIVEDSHEIVDLDVTALVLIEKFEQTVESRISEFVLEFKNVDKEGFKVFFTDVAIEINVDAPKRVFLINTYSR